MKVLDGLLVVLGKAETIKTTRREVGKLLGSAAALNFLSAITTPTSAASVDEKNNDVSYLWHHNLEVVLDFMEEVGKRLGPDVEKGLHIVKGKINYGLVYDRNGTRREALRTANIHQRILKPIGIEATPIEDTGYSSLFNVRYGNDADLERLISQYKIVYTMLGPDVGKDLVIEKVNEQHALTWRRRGDEEATKVIAKRHQEILKSKGIPTFIIKESNNAVVYGESSYLNEEKPPSKPPRKHPELRLPVASGELERTIEEYVRKHRTADEQTSWSVYDFTTGEKIVSINENSRRQSASMIKPLVALAYFHLVQQGRLQYGSTSKEHMKKMIQKSNNASTNWVIQQVGGPSAVQRILKQQYKNIFKETFIVEYVPRGGQTYRNKASAHDYSRFLYALWNDELPQAREIRRLMALPGRDRVYTGAERVPAGTLVYNKTGSTARLCGDLAIISARGEDGQRYAYTLIGIIEKRRRAQNYGAWIQSRGDIIREVSNLVYDHIKARHNLI